ncbi:MAG TPA: SGNH/GDSL hydrolase family protein [Sphingomonas sp.]|jgi:outer membrane lipase/esterase|nr:SGNH/GDSL hydrolase family protein [Sphingomonas sp.]
MKMRMTLGICLAAAAAAATPAQAQQATTQFTSLTVFGDSLVDAGNIRALNLGANPAQGYFEGRFTNGYDYTDLLSIQLFGAPTVASLRGGTNFAYGGARATTTSLVPDLVEQLAAFDAYRAAGNSVDANGLYILNFGGNDVFAAQAAGAPTGYASDSAFLQDAAAKYAGGVGRLRDLGARNILITGFPVATGAGLALSLEAEAYLTAALGGLNLGSETNLLRYSYLDFFQRLQTNPGAFGLPSLILPDATRPDGGTCRGANAFPACTGYFSFDGTHPTAAVHQALFNDMNRQFALAVPEPATWAMMIVGFGLVGGAMRRTRRARVRVAFAA